MDAPDPRTPALDSVRRAYDSWSAEYVEQFGSASKASEEDREAVTAWSRTVVGPVLDAGCGPGHWSAHLRSSGLQVEGVDATEAFVRYAARAHPRIPFRQGDLRTLDVPPATLGGVLAWFSLIHLDPSEVPGVLRGFAAALRPDRSALIGFFSGPDLTPFDHRVVTAWAWPVQRMAAVVEEAGLEVIRTSERPRPSGRVLAEITGRRPAGDAPA